MDLSGNNRSDMRGGTGVGKMRFLCWIGWHRPNAIRAMRGINIVSICRGCGAEIMRDSQGNWF